MAAGETTTVIEREMAPHHALTLSGIRLTLPNTYFKAISKTYEEIFKRSVEVG